MKKIIKEIKEKGIIQCTIADERWYIKSYTDDEEHKTKFYPSVTWICSYYPKGYAFYKWLASKGWDEAEAIKVAGGDRGSKVHLAIDDLLHGKEVKMQSRYYSEQTGQEEELTLEEYDCILSFVAWFEKYKPKTILSEYVILNDKYNYAGTIDYVCEVNGQIWIIDFKTSQNIYPENEIQVSAYAKSLMGESKEVSPHFGKDGKMFILQLGYRRNKDKYKMTEISNKFNLFLVAQRIWKEEASKQQPFVRDYPVSLRLGGDDGKDKNRADNREKSEENKSNKRIYRKNNTNDRGK